VSSVGYESVNRLTNAGTAAWTPATGLLSIWMLGMLNASPETTVVVPIREGAESELGVRVNSDYFGKIPSIVDGMSSGSAGQAREAGDLML
jgi:hypothetical protein